MKKNKEMIFGIHPITEAIAAGTTIAKIWIKHTTKHPGLHKLTTLAQQHNIPHCNVPIAKLNRLTNSNHQGAIALISPIPIIPLDTILQTLYEQPKQPSLIILNHLQDMRNLGAIARTALAADVDAIILNTQQSLAITGDAIKTSAGALLKLPIARTNNLRQTLRTLAHSGLQLIACTAKAKQTIYQTNLKAPTAFLLGGEHQPLRTQTLTLCHQHVAIPMNPAVESLNVSVATAIILYEHLRQNTTPT